MKICFTCSYNCRNLEVLTLGRMFLSEMFFFALSERASLRKLSITGANLGSGGAQEIQLRHEEIRELHIAKCRVLRIAIRYCFDLISTQRLVLHIIRLQSFSPCDKYVVLIVVHINCAMFLD